MSTFDVAINFGEKNLNSIVAAFFSRPALKSKLFYGQKDATIEGSQAAIAWEMRSPPTFSLAPPSPDQWKHAITANGNVAEPHDNACLVWLPNFHYSATLAGGAPTQSTLSLSVVGTVVVSGQTATVVPVGVILDLSRFSAFDQVVYKSILIPQVLAQASRFLGSQAVPKIDFHGIAFGAPTLLVEQGRAVVGAFLAGRPSSPDRQALRATPGGDFHVLLSREALQLIVQNGVQSLRGHTESVSGQAGFGIGNANYSASIRLDSLNAEILSPTTLRAHAGVTLHASAGVDVLPAIFNQIGHGVAKAGEAIGHAAKDAASTVGHAAKDAASTVGHAAEKAGGAVVHVFKSY